MLTGADVVKLPAASRATAVKVYHPLGTVLVSAETREGAAVTSVPRLMPLYLNCTPATPRLSDAVALTVIVPVTLDPAAGEVTLTGGGVASGGSCVSTVTGVAVQAEHL